MSLIGLDWCSTRVLAVLGRPGEYPLPAPLEPPALELPMALSLQKSQAEVGSAGLRLRRHSPHLVCHGFLPQMGDPSSQRWKHGRRTLDATQATVHVWQRLANLCKGSRGIMLSAPAYLSTPQAELLRGLGEKCQLPVLGTVPTPLAVALTAYAQQLWSSSALVVDADDHALTLAVVRAAAEQGHLVEAHVHASLGLSAWKDRLVNALADLCIWQTRRDPRDNAASEQSLYEQLDSLLDACLRQQPLQLALQGANWYQHLLVLPGQTLGFCTPLVRRAALAVEDLVASVFGTDAPGAILVTEQASRLPGLLPALRVLQQAWGQPGEAVADRPRTCLEDFGENLLFEGTSEAGDVFVLSADAAARGAHQLGDAVLTGELPRGHLDSFAPLPAAQPVEAGPARVHYQGRDYVLKEPSFFLGTQPACHLYMDPSLHPQVDDRHCEIRFDRRAFVLLDRSRRGTLVNDAPVAGSVVLRAGDWIRLGVSGPALRFLGRPLPRTSLVTA